MTARVLLAVVVGREVVVGRLVITIGGLSVTSLAGPTSHEGIVSICIKQHEMLGGRYCTVVVISVNVLRLGCQGDILGTTRSYRLMLTTYLHVWKELQTNVDHISTCLEGATDQC